MASSGRRNFSWRLTIWKNAASTAKNSSLAESDGMLKPRLKLEDVHSSHRRLPLSACVEKRIRSPPLSPVSAATSPIGRGKERLKELRELTRVRDADAIVQIVLNQQEQQRSFLYHTRWHHVRNFYAITCEVMAAASVKRNLVSSSTSSSLGDFVRECRRAFPNSDVTLAQLEIALQNALRVDAQSSRFAEITTRLKSVFQAFQRTGCALRVDIRELLCALFVLDRWQLATCKMLLLWFDQFSTVTNSNNSGSSSQQAILKSELRQMLITACEGATDEMRLLPFLQELLHLNDGGSYITERAFLAYMDTRAAFLETIHLQCWTRLTDDTRLAFYRDLVLQAMQHFENEQLKVRMRTVQSELCDAWCNESGTRFCIACYADDEHKRRLNSQEDNNVLLTWTKLPVQPAKCIVCRNALADVVCHECRGDATCTRCFDAVHRNHPTRKTHTNRDFLINSDSGNEPSWAREAWLGSTPTSSSHIGHIDSPPEILELIPQKRDKMSALNEEAEEQKNLGNEEFNVKNFDKAIEYYSEAIRLDPANHVYYSNRRCFDSLFSLPNIPGNARNDLYLRGDVMHLASAAYGAVGNWVQAEADAQECVKRNPRFAKGYHRLANAQKQLGRNADAIATLQAAQANAADAGKNPGIKKLLRDLNQESGASSGAPAVAGPGGRALPPAVAKELQELQPQFMTIQREVDQIDAKLAAFARQKKRVALVEKELAELPESTTTYQSVGKMFLQTTKDENFASMKSEARKVDDQVSSLEARKNYLNRQKTSLEENITELLAQVSTS
ncbi:Heat shock protein sti1, partial [Globisporangium splendens]